MEVAGRSKKNDNFCVLGDLVNSDIAVYFRLLVRISIDGACAFAFNTRIGGDAGDACVNDLLDVGKLSLTVVCLDDDAVIAVSDAVFNQGVFFLIVSLAIEYVQSHVIIRIELSSELICQPCCEGVFLCSCDISNSESVISQSAGSHCQGQNGCTYQHTNCSFLHVITSLKNIV